MTLGRTNEITRLVSALVEMSHMHPVCNYCKMVSHKGEQMRNTSDMREWLVPSTCLGCAFRIVAFRRKIKFPGQDHIIDDSVYITTLSDHVHLHHNSWRGRLYFAWKSLKGDPPDDISLELPEDISAFRKAMDEVYEWLNNDPEGKVV